MKKNIITQFLLIFAFLILNNYCNGQNQFSTELRYKISKYAYPWNTVSGITNSRIYLLGSYSIDKNSNHQITTGLFLNPFTIKGDSMDLFDETISRVIYTDFTVKDYFLGVPIYYRFNTPHFYSEIGFNGRLIAASRLYYGDKLIRKAKNDIPLLIEYHLGLGYQKSFENLNFRLGITADNSIKGGFFDYGVNVGVEYKFQKNRVVK